MHLRSCDPAWLRPKRDYNTATAGESQIGVSPSICQNATGLARSTYVYDSRQLSILIPETRRLMTLPVVALQAHVQLPELRIQIMYGQFQQGLRPHAETACGTAAERCCLPRTHAGQSNSCQPVVPRCTLPDAHAACCWPPRRVCWRRRTHGSAMGPHEHLKDFLQYDYVGSRWYMFLDILRDLEAMLNITKSFRPSGRPEELWFCSHLQSDAMRLSARRNTLPGRPTRHRRIRSRVLFCPRRP